MAAFPGQHSGGSLGYAWFSWCVTLPVLASGALCPWGTLDQFSAEVPTAGKGLPEAPCHGL